MATRDLEKRRAARRRYLAKKRGIPVDQLPEGRGNNPASWGNHTVGPDHPRWSEDRMISADGYVKVRVGVEHPLADPNGYTYEHLLVWVAAGNARPEPGYLLHHKNEVKSDNRLSNLELKDRYAHGVGHAAPLSDRQIRGMRWRYAATGHDTATLAALYGVPIQSAWKIVRGKTRARAGGPIQVDPLRGRKRPRLAA